METKHISFYSNASPPYNKLSNFHYASFEFKTENMSETMKEVFPDLEDWLGEGLVFSSSEHLWQALKCSNKKDFLKFAKGGQFDKLNSETFEKIDPKCDGENKVNYWSKKNNVGIIPKMVSSRGKQLGLKNYNTNDFYLNAQQERDIWIDILTEKYVQNPELKKLLLSTWGLFLLEFDKGARRSNSYWGGYIDDDGEMYGKNKMGDYLMILRFQLKKKRIIF